ncbi:hypothetical protein [Pseudomonas sp. MF6747]|uniref:hypothetical protein n=1 Tax=Pseudomonas sp. MF6747 TaxID=2797527 RepID=UPI0019098EA4|nr:hypothetical protein [Pseudomonas sp. MF6747]MBK3506774.1 hypothetical protein [Pseudomonas sp. MF6747]
MNLKETENKQVLAFLTIVLTLAASASLATALFMKLDVGFWYQIAGYFLIFIYHIFLLIALVSIETEKDEPKQLELELS